MMENKYFTPDITDIRVGYKCELLMSENVKNDGDVWVYTLNPEATWQPFEFTTGSDLMWFTPYILREQLRTLYLTQEQIESCGFTLKAKSIDYWFEINEDKRFDTDLQNFGGYKCYNVFLNYGFHDHKLKIKGDFTGGEKFDKAETLFEGECKCINELRQILKQIHITPFYGE